jgi:hypothetical protein
VNLIAGYRFFSVRDQIRGLMVHVLINRSCIDHYNLAVTGILVHVFGYYEQHVKAITQRPSIYNVWSQNVMCILFSGYAVKFTELKSQFNKASSVLAWKFTVKLCP